MVTKKSYFQALYVSFIASLLALPLNAEPLSLQVAISKAVKNHPYIDSKIAEVSVSDSEVDVSYREFLPTVTVGAQEGQGNVNQQYAMISQPIYTFGRLTGQHELAKSNLAAAKLGVTEAEQSILNETVNRFIELYRSEQNIQVAKDNIVEHQRLLGIITRRVEASTSPEVDSRLALARLQYAESEHFQFMNQAMTSKSSLAQLIGEDVYTITTPNFDLELENTLLYITEKALDFSPRLAKLDEELKSQTAQVKISEASMYPQLTLNYEKRYGDLLFGQQDEQIYVALQYQPGAGFSAGAKHSAAKARKNALISSRQASERELKVQIETAWNQYLMSQRQLEPARVLAEATNDVVESYLRQYVVGRKSWLDVLNAQRESSQAKYTLVNYKTLYLQSFYQLQILTGELNANTVVEL